MINVSLAEDFYYVNYGSPIITSNNLRNENINTGVSREMILQKYVLHLVILIYIISPQDIFQITKKKQQTEN